MTFRSAANRASLPTTRLMRQALFETVFSASVMVLQAPSIFQGCRSMPKHSSAVAAASSSSVLHLQRQINSGADARSATWPLHSLYIIDCSVFDHREPAFLLASWDWEVPPCASGSSLHVHDFSGQTLGPCLTIE